MNLFKDFEAVIFDMDGVVVNSEELWDTYEVQFLKEYITGVSKGMQDKIVESCLGLSVFNRFKLIKRYCPKELEGMLEQDFANAYVNFGIENVYNKTDLIDGIQYYFENLFSGKKVALASSSPALWVNETLDKHNLHKYFELVFTGDCVKKAKPDPEIYLKTADELGIEPSKCVVLEDSKNGIIAGKAAGMKVYALRNGVNDNQDLSYADLILNGFISDGYIDCKVRI